MGLASAAEQLKMTFPPLQTVSSLTCNRTPSGGSVKEQNSLSTVITPISSEIRTLDLVNKMPFALADWLEVAKIPIHSQSTKRKLHHFVIPVSTYVFGRIQLM